MSTFRVALDMSHGIPLAGGKEISHRIRIAEPCIEVKDTASVSACPVDYTHPPRAKPISKLLRCPTAT